MGKNVIISTLPNISQNYLPKVNTSNIFANSLVYDDGSSVLINTTTASAFRLDVNGTARTGALTLTGALSGTSATFSSNFYVSGGTNTNVGNGIHAYYESNYAQIQLNGAAAGGSIIDFSTDGTDYKGRIIYVNSTNQFQFYTNATTALTLASTGAATFSSSVAVGAGMTIGTSGTNDISWGTAGGIKLSRTNVGPEYALSQRWTGTLAYIDIASSTQWNGGVTILPNGGGNVGIGTTSPSGGISGTETALHIYNTNAAVLALQSADPTNGRKYQIYTGNTGALIFRDDTGASTRMVITNGGNVGIGTTSPAVPLHISSSSSEILRINPATSGYLSWYRGATWAGYIDAESGGDMTFANATSTGNLKLLTNSNTRLYVSASGNVGIGTTSPSGKLDIAGSLGNFYVGTSGAELFFTRNENNDFLANAGSSAGIRFGAQSYLRFDTGTTLTERMRITSGGNVLIGITGEYPYQGGALLRINKEQNTGTNIQINNQANNASAAAHVIFSTYGNGWTIGMGSSSSSSGNSFYFSPDPSAALNKVATLTTAGVWSTSGGGTSDRRTKNNIQYITENVLNKISELKPVEFEFLLCPNKKRRGFIAQDVLETTLPDLVLGNGDEVNGTYGLDYDGILALAVKAIQEQQAQIEVQKADIESLKALINK